MLLHLCPGCLSLPTSARKRKSFGGEKATWAESCFPGQDLGTLSRACKILLEMQRWEGQVLPTAALGLENQAGLTFRVPFLCPDGKNSTGGWNCVRAGVGEGWGGMWACLPMLEEQHAQVPAPAASLWVLSTPASTQAVILQNHRDLGRRCGCICPEATYPNCLVWGFVRADFLVGCPLWA